VPPNFNTNAKPSHGEMPPKVILKKGRSMKRHLIKCFSDVRASFLSNILKQIYLKRAAAEDNNGIPGSNDQRQGYHHPAFLVNVNILYVYFSAKCINYCY
jgi:hypothetical protein